MQFSNKYIFLFCLGMCLICSVCISVTAVMLRPRQEYNQLLEKKRSVLQACWLMQPGEKLAAADIDERFKAIEPKVIDLETGEYVEDIDIAAFETEAKENMVPAGDNIAKNQKVPTRVKIYQHMEDGRVKRLILPVYGKGLWGTLYGFLALDADANTIKGLTFYSHKETPGLGAEVDNPKWKALWPERKAYDANGDVKIRVIKGRAGSPEEAPHEVDGLSGATLTSRGVTNLLRYWLGEDGYKSYLDNFKAERSA